MVTTSSIVADHEAKRPRPTLEKAKVVNLSKQLQIRLQYARLKVEHGWQRQSLNEVENLYFHHSTLKGRPKASGPSSSFARPASALGGIVLPSTASSPSSKAASGSSRTTKGGRVAYETSHAAPTAYATSSSPAVLVSSPPTLATPQGSSPPSQSSTPVKGSSSHTAKSTPMPSGTPSQTQVSETARSLTLSPSLLSAFTQNYAVTQQLSRTATMDFSSLSPFVTSSFSGSSSSITAPSSFVPSVPPSPFSTQTLAYLPSPFAPPPASSVPISSAPSLPMSQFTAPPYPVVMPIPDISASLSTFPPTSPDAFPSLVQSPSPAPAPASTPTPTPAHVSTPAPAPAPPQTAELVPAPTSIQTRSPAPAPPTHPQKPPPPASAHPPAPLSSFRSSKTFDIPTAPGPGTLAGTGAQSATALLTYDSFWSSHSSAAGSWRRAIGNSSGSGAAAAANLPASTAATGGGPGLGGSSAKA